ncbi:sialate O-acetylesterase [Larkinella rosea]|uniref:Sialate O-acetylesterase domain-containing protein n=1 Tax=Larkinella rosea TaxID=2025312 RepID=A0A3P1C257_9BACT|nr:sialate O-acetylesterase [Larkinella rosea]RRB07461.1 hypothetical protein EHT25_06685 [Larkinella rosea]
MRKKSTGFWWVLLLLCPYFSFAQVSVKWQKWPANLQLYPRDNQNKSEVPIVGQLQTTKYSTASVWVFKNDVKWKYQRVAVSKNGNQSQIQFNPTIEAGLNQYKFMVYAIEGKDSVLVDSRDNIVCGDIILCNGQSNLTGYNPNDYFYRNNFVRAFGNSAGAKPDTIWRLSNVQDGQVGRIATEIQRLILENFNMPTCMINGSVGGTSIKSHIYRNPANPADHTTLYGRLLYWAQKAGAIGRIKAFIWRQGENEAGGGSTIGYEDDIRTLFGNWQNDYPNIGKYYVAQVNLLPDGNKGAAQLRDFQRRTPQIFPRTEAIATVGLPAYGGVHYGPEGQIQFAKEVFRLLARDFYQSSDVSNVSSPNIQKAYYKTADKKEVVLEFEPGATMVWKQDTVVSGVLRDIRDFIYFDYNNVQQERVIASGSAEGNRITLKLTKPVSASTITYLPNNFATPFGGPFLVNRRGMRALTFHKVTLEAASTTPPTENPPVENPPTNPSPNPPGTNYGGSLDGVSCGNIWGWVYNVSSPNAPITVEFLANNVVVGSIVASNFRQDLKNAGKGNGEHGFNFTPPASIKNGLNQEIKARVVGTTYFLPGGPKNMTCANTGTPVPPVENPPTNPPTNPSPNPPGTNYGGNLDGVSCGNIWGWVYNVDAPNAPITVEFLANNVVVGSIKAANFRQDLKNANKGNGEHGFNYTPPSTVKNGQNQSIRVRVVGTGYFLPGSPKNMTCPNNTRTNAEAPEVNLAVTVYPNPTAGRLNIRLFIPEKQTAFLRMLDVSGRVVWQQTVLGLGKIHDEVVEVPNTVLQSVLISAEIGNASAVKKVLISR